VGRLLEVLSWFFPKGHSILGRLWEFLDIQKIPLSFYTKLKEPLTVPIWEQLGILLMRWLMDVRI
jgi:hypothetical protein